jgi:spore photoproduct lyase
LPLKSFHPKRVFFEEAALDFPLGQKIFTYCNEHQIEIKHIGSHNRVTGIPGDTPQQSYSEAKRTLVVGVKRDLRFDSCKPSADFEFSLGTSCPGGCEYCYLQTHLGKKPYIRVYVNVDQILDKIKEMVEERQPQISTFEAASTSDPVAVEHLTGSLAKSIEFFGGLSHGRMRVVTKFANVRSLLSLNHNQQTKFRFSLNTAEIIRRFEHNTSSMDERITAAGQVAEAGYPLGFIIAPLFIYPGYAAGYEDLFQKLSQTLHPIPPNLSFELITHRFTRSAKNVILERFPNTGLDMDEDKRKRKFGRYGLAKYIYNDTDYAELKQTLLGLVEKYFPDAQLEYFT